MDCAMCHEARAADPLSLLTLSESLKNIVNRVIRWLRDHSCSVIEPGSAHTACRGAAIASLGVPCSALSPALNCALLLTPLGKLDKNMSFECIQLHKSCWKALKASIYEVHSGLQKTSIYPRKETRSACFYCSFEVFSRNAVNCTNAGCSLIAHTCCVPARFTPALVSSPPPSAWTCGICSSEPAMKLSDRKIVSIEAFRLRGPQESREYLVLYATPLGFECREWMLEADIAGCVVGLEKLSGYAGAGGGRDQPLLDLTGIDPRSGVATLAHVLESSPVHGPAKRRRAKPVADAPACTSRMAASTTAPFNVHLLSGQSDAVWHTLAHSTLKYGLFESCEDMPGRPEVIACIQANYPHVSPGTVLARLKEFLRDMKGFSDACVSLPATITSNCHFKKLEEFINTVSESVAARQAAQGWLSRFGINWDCSVNDEQLPAVPASTAPIALATHVRTCSRSPGLDSEFMGQLARVPCFPSEIEADAIRQMGTHTTWAVHCSCWQAKHDTLLLTTVLRFGVKLHPATLETLFCSDVGFHNAAACASQPGDACPQSIAVTPSFELTDLIEARNVSDARMTACIIWCQKRFDFLLTCASCAISMGPMHTKSPQPHDTSENRPSSSGTSCISLLLTEKAAAVSLASARFSDSITLTQSLITTDKAIEAETERNAEALSRSLTELCRSVAEIAYNSTGVQATQLFDVCESIWGQFMAANEPSVPQVQPPTTSPRLDSTADVLPAVVPALIAAPTQCIPALQSTRARSLSPCSPRELASTPSSSGTVLVARKKTAATVSTDVPSIGNVVRDSILQPSRIVVNPVVPLSQLVVPTVIAHSKPAHASKKVAAHDVAPPLPVSALEGADTCLPLLVAQELQVPGDQPTANAALSTDTATAALPAQTTKPRKLLKKRAHESVIGEAQSTREPAWKAHKAITVSVEPDCRDEFSLMDFEVPKDTVSDDATAGHVKENNMEHEVLDDAFFLLVALQPGHSQDDFIRNALAFLLKYVFKLRRSYRNGLLSRYERKGRMLPLLSSLNSYVRNAATVLCTRFRSSKSNAARCALLEAAGIPSTPRRLTTDDAWNVVFRPINAIWSPIVLEWISAAARKAFRATTYPTVMHANIAAVLLMIFYFLQRADVHRISDVVVDTRLILSNSARFLALFKMVECVDALKDLLKA